MTVLVKQLQQEESLPEEQRPTAHARALYIKVLNIIIMNKYLYKLSVQCCYVIKPCALISHD